MLELEQIALISTNVDNTVCVVTRDGFMACSCGWTDMDGHRSVSASDELADELHRMLLESLMEAS